MCLRCLEYFCILASLIQVMDVIGLHLLVKNSQPPETNALNTPEDRLEWTQKVICYRPIVERIFAYFADYKNEVPKPCTDILKYTR